MAARLQVNIECRAFRFGTRTLECNDFGVIPTGELMKTRSDDSSISHQHRSNNRIGTGPAGTLQGETTSQAEIAPIFRTTRYDLGQPRHPRRGREASAFPAGRFLRSWISSSSSTMNSLMSLKERYTEAKRT